MPSPFSWSPVLPVFKSGNPDVDSLLGNFKWPGSVTYSFPGAGATWSTDPSTGYGAAGSSTGEPWSADYTPLTSTDQQYFAQALATWTRLTNLTATQVADTSGNVGDIRAAYTTLASEPEAQAWAYNPDNASWAGDVWFNYQGSSAYRNWTPGSYEFLTAVHEIGHALGFIHPFAANPPIRSALNSIVYTVMSYSAVPGNQSSSLSYWPTTPMVIDVEAIQYLYGANMTYHASDDVYVYAGTSRYMETIWDAGGNDTIRADGTRAVKIDLREGLDYGSRLGVPVTEGTTQTDQVVVNNVWIAYGAKIENAIGGDGNDTLVGNDLNNQLTGRAGNDSLDGLGGIDTALYSATRVSYTVTVAGGRPTAVTGPEGSDTLANIERLHFSDVGVAYDLEGNAGAVAKLLGAVFGSTAVSNTSYVRIGLDYLDAGGTLDNLYALALSVKLGAGYAVGTEVDLLYQNLLHTLPTADARQGWVDAVANGTFTTVTLAELAAGTSLNAANIDLVGLTNNGLTYA